MSASMPLASTRWPGTTSSAPRTTADLARLARAGRRARRAGARHRRRHRPRGARPGRSRARRDGHRRRSRARASLRATAPGSAGCRCARRPPTRAPSTSARAIRWRSWPMQVAQLLGGARGRAAMLDAVAQHLAPGGLLAIALADPYDTVPADEALPPLPDMLEIDGWVLSSTPVDRPRRRRRRGDRPPPPGRLAHRRADRGGVDDPPGLGHPRRARGEAERAGLTAAGPVAGARHPRLRGQHDRACSRPPRERHAARLRALPRADEHLRRPGQHRRAARALRVARHRLRARLRQRRRPARPGRPTTSSTSAAARTATRRRWPRTWPRPSARPCTLRRRASAVVLAVCGGYQLLGESYAIGDHELPGVGLVDLRTVREEGPRLIGNCAIEADLGTARA